MAAGRATLLCFLTLSHFADGEGGKSCPVAEESVSHARGAELRLRGGGGVNKLAPAFDVLASPPTIPASKDLKMAELYEPTILTGLLKDDWRLPRDFLQHEGRKLRVDVNPLDDGDEAPRKLLENSTLISPATMAVPMSEVLDLLQKGPENRGFHAYVRHFSLEGYPEVRTSLLSG
eukprot:2096453-Rhodomonas_salina.2